MIYNKAKLIIVILVVVCVVLATMLGEVRQTSLAYVSGHTSHVITEPGNTDKIMRTTRIPKIIHQFWDDEIIPTEFLENIRSLVRDNKMLEWQYYFWTMKTARALIKNKYPEFLKTSDKYPDNLSLADAMRYVVLFEYGGVYFDLDTVSVKPLEPFLQQHLCTFVQEPIEHSLVYGVDYFLTTSAMLCRPRHPIFCFIIDRIPSIGKACHDPHDCTGPAVLTKLYTKYNAKPYDNINVVPTDLFQDQYFIRMQGPQIREQCKNLKSLNKVQSTRWRCASDKSKCFHVPHISL